MHGKTTLSLGLIGGGVALALVGWATTRHAPAPRLGSASASAPRAPSAAPAPESSAAPAVRDTAVWKVPVEPDDPTKGDPQALVTIVAFSDLQSAFTKRAAETLDQLLAQYPKELRVVWKDSPQPHNQQALP